MHPFRWTPAEGKRHATLIGVGSPGIYPVFEQVETLCGESVEVAELTELAWLWGTCVDCNERAHRRVETV